MEEFEEIAKERWDETYPTPEKILEKFKEKGKEAGESVMALNPGRELNILVAKHVMGHEVKTDAIMGEMERILDIEGDYVWASVYPYSEELRRILSSPPKSLILSITKKEQS